MKQKVAETCGVSYVILGDIQNNEEYMCSLGTEVYGDDGTVHIVEHNGVARHPSDKGMEYIANAIIDKLCELE